MASSGLAPGRGRSAGPRRQGDSGERWRDEDRHVGHRWTQRVHAGGGSDASRATHLTVPPKPVSPPGDVRVFHPLGEPFSAGRSAVRASGARRATARAVTKTWESRREQGRWRATHKARSPFGWFVRAWSATWGSSGRSSSAEQALDNGSRSSRRTSPGYDDVWRSRRGTTGSATSPPVRLVGVPQRQSPDPGRIAPAS